MNDMWLEGMEECVRCSRLVSLDQLEYVIEDAGLVCSNCRKEDTDDGMDDFPVPAVEV